MKLNIKKINLKKSLYSNIENLFLRIKIKQKTLYHSFKIKMFKMIKKKHKISYKVKFNQFFNKFIELENVIYFSEIIS
jgi:hypothetical protein